MLHMEGEQRSNQIQYGNGRPDQAPSKTFGIARKAKLGLEATAILTTVASLVGCAPKEGIHPSQVPTMGETPGATQLFTPIATENPFTQVPPENMMITPKSTLAEFLPSGSSTETPVPTPKTTQTSESSTATATAVAPREIPGFLAGLERPLEEGFQINPLTSALQKAINEAGYGVVGVDGQSVGSQLGTVCKSDYPEQVFNKQTAKAESFSRWDNDIAIFGETRVNTKVNVFPNTATETYSCALGYTKDNNAVLTQLLIRTDVDGSIHVVGTLPATFAKGEIVNDSAWIMKTAETNWSLEIPATPDKCTNVIRDDTYEHTEADIASLNKKIMEQKWFADLPAGQFPMRTEQMGIKPWHPPITGAEYVPYPNARIEMWYNANNPDGSSIDAVITSCSKYKDGYLVGTFIGINNQMVPIQILMDAKVLQGYLKKYASVGQDARPFVERALSDYQLRDNGKTFAASIELFGEFDQHPQYKESTTGVLGSYLDKTYDYSELMKRVLNHETGDITEIQKAIDLMQKVPIPGYFRLEDQTIK